MKKALVATQWLLAAALIVLVVPLCLAGFYNRPLADDLTQPYAVAQTYAQTGSFLSALAAALKQTLTAYLGYNGLFFSMFLSALAPTAFFPQLGWLHPIVMLTMIITACFHVSRCLKILDEQASPAVMNILAMLASMLILLLLPSVFEGIYWYSGAINYTFTFCLAVHLFSAVSIRAFAKGVSTSPLALGLLCLGFFLVGGGNLGTMTASLTTYVFLALGMVLCKRPKRFLIPALFLLAGACMTVLAPGNNTRMGYFGEPRGILPTLGMCYRSACDTLTMDTSCFVFSLLTLPFAFLVSSKASVSWRALFAVAFAGFQILAASYAPIHYVTGYGMIVPRIRNISFILMLLLVLSLSFLLQLKLCRFVKERFSSARAQQRLACLSIVICFAAASFFAVLSLPDLSLRNGELVLNCQFPSIKAISHLKAGTFRQYAQQYDEIAQALRMNPHTAIVRDYHPHCELIGEHSGGGRIDWMEDPTFGAYYGGSGASVTFSH